MATAIKTLSPKQKLIAQINKNGGITENRKALQSLQSFVSVEMKNIDAKKVRQQAWK